MSNTTVILTSVGLVASTVVAYLLYRQKQKKPESRTVGKVSHIRLYPIKSGPPLFLTNAECTETGLKYKNVRDRQFVLVGETTFIAIRNNLKLLDLQLTYEAENDCLVLAGPGMKSDLNIPLTAPEYDPSKVKSLTWFDKRETFYFDYGSEYSEWLTEYLGQQCILGYAHNGITRGINPEMTYNNQAVHPETRLTFSNSHPYLVANQTSLDDLNTRIEEKITLDSFRPNIVVSRENDDSLLTPYEEDAWREISIGQNVVMYNARPCPRCPMIYVDYEKHEMRPNKEPMTTMLKYRRGTVKKDKSKTVFGINTSVISRGYISCGSKVVTISAQ